MKYIKTVNLDIDYGINETIKVKQNDTARFILFRIMTNGLKFNLYDYQIKFFAIKSDGTHIFNDLKIINADEGLAELNLTEQTLAIQGFLKSEICIYGEDGVLSSMPIKFEVIGSTRNSVLESTNEFSALTGALAQITDFDNRINNKLEKDGLINVSQINKNNGKITIEYLDDEVLQAMTGETPINTTPADNSITTVKLIDKAVIPSKLGLLEGYILGRGIININTTLKKVEVASGGWCTTVEGNFIKINAGTYDYSQALAQANNYMIFAFLNPINYGIEFFPKLLVPKNNGYIYLFAYYSNAITGNNSYACKVNGEYQALKKDEIEINKQQINSTNIAVANLGGAKVIDGSNLFDKNSAILGFYVNWQTGKLTTNSNYFASDWIELLPNTKYTVNKRDQLAFFDSNFTYISGVGNSSDVPLVGQPYTFTTPPNCKYLRICNSITYINMFVVSSGEEVKNNISHDIKMAQLVVNNENIDSIDISKLTQIKSNRNLFDIKKAIDGKYVSFSTGVLNDNASCFATDFMPVVEGLQYTVSHKQQIAWYNRNYEYITGEGEGTHLPYTYIAPKGSKYARSFGYLSYKNIYQFEEGEFSSECVEHKKTFNGFKPSILDFEECIRSKNLFNKQDIIKNKYISFSTGLVKDATGYFASLFIDVESNTTYVRTTRNQMAFYDINKNYISGQGNVGDSSFTTPTNCKYVRVSDFLTNLDSYQIELGSEITEYEPYYTYSLKGLKGNEGTLNSYKKPICTLQECWLRWCNNEKFPLGFLGDSTTDGVGTTGWLNVVDKGHQATDEANGGIGSVDWRWEYAYSNQLEKIIREETGTTYPRIYNLGYSGTTTVWARPIMENLFGGAYRDIKMVGLAHGINDRLRANTKIEYERLLRSNFTYMIEWLLEKGIQPFMVLQQAIVSPSVAENYIGQYALRDSESVETVCNKVKLDLAKIYNLEVVDINTIGKDLFDYSKINLTTLIKDTLHFGDIGHKFEAGAIFSQICPRVIKISKLPQILSFSNQCIKSKVPENKTTYIEPINGFKIKADYVKSNAEDILIQDFYIFNDTKQQLNLYSYVNKVNNKCYVLVNGEKTVITNVEQNICELEIGLHHIQAFTGETNIVDFLGFKLN